MVEQAISRVHIRLPALHDGQRQVIEADDARFWALVCGRQWGKTRLGVWWIMRAGLRGGCWWWVAPVYQISEIAWKIARRMAAQINRQHPRFCDIRLGDRAIVFPATGGETIFRSADRPDNLRGPTLDGLVLDEADYVDQYVWQDVLTPALGVKRGKALLISSPRIEGGWFHRAWASGLDDDSVREALQVQRNPTIRSFRFPTWTSPYFDQQALAEARRDTPELVYRREYGAEFVSSAGTLVKREHLRYGAPGRTLPIVFGVDLAISKQDSSDYSAIVVMCVDTLEGGVFVLDVWRDRVSFRGVMAVIKSMAEQWAPVVIAIEQVAYQAAVVQELLITTTLPIRGVTPVADKVLRFQPLVARYEQGLVYHAPGLIPAWEQELLAFPVGVHDDMVDAAANAYSEAATSVRIITGGTRPSFEELAYGDGLGHLDAMG